MKLPLVFNAVLVILLQQSCCSLGEAEETESDAEEPVDDVLYGIDVPDRLVEGDIQLSPEEYAIFQKSGWKGLMHSEAWLNVRMWPTTIPYSVDSNVDDVVKRRINDSIEIFESTCLRFVPRGPGNMNQPYVRFRRHADSCFTGLGMPRSGSRDIYLGSGCTHAVAAHEILHVLGRLHEQSRPDRDNYVDVFPQNFQTSTMFNIPAQFSISPNAQTLGLGYDYDSVMHYPRNAFSVSFFLNTIAPNRPGIDARRLGQIWGMTALDLAHVNIRYCGGAVQPPMTYSGWPKGTFSLPKPNTLQVCPSNTEQGSVVQDNENRRPTTSNRSVPIHLDGQFLRDTRITYCTFTKSSGCGIWPAGSYCIAKYGNLCPLGFQEGNIFWDDEDGFGSNSNRIEGTVPAGVYNRDTRIFYCCRSDGPITTPMVLPTDVPFILLRQSADGCQEVAGMSVIMEFVETNDENRRNDNSITGSAPYVTGRRNYRLFYCYYSK